MPDLAETRDHDKTLGDEGILISVDVETSGPNPGLYSLLSIGACLVDRPEIDFYVELKPVSENATKESLKVSGLDLHELQTTGMEPADAMKSFATWISQVTPEGAKPIFVGFNASFDWMFVCDYFWRYLGDNPFGHSAIDIKSFALPFEDGDWSKTTLKNLSEKYLDGRTLTHNALDDARDQGAIFSAIAKAANLP